MWEVGVQLCADLVGGYVGGRRTIVRRPGGWPCGRSAHNCTRTWWVVMWEVGVQLYADLVGGYWGFLLVLHNIMKITSTSANDFTYDMLILSYNRKLRIVLKDPLVCGNESMKATWFAPREQAAGIGIEHKNRAP